MRARLSVAVLPLWPSRGPMNHYTKLALLTIRLFATGMFLIGCMGLVYQFFPYRPEERIGRLMSSIAFIAVGVLVYAIGKPISKAITKDL